MMSWLAVASGGAIGATARYGVGILCTRLFGTSFPYGTLSVNILGCLFAGLLIGFLSFREPIDVHLKLFLMVGILGGFTTFSAFSTEAILLFERKPTLAGLYIAASVISSILACFVGLRIMRMVMA